MTRKTRVSAISGLIGLTLLVSATAAQAQGIAPAPDEKEQLKACEEQICTTLNAKDAAASGDMSCKLSKTWQKSSIADGVRQKNISWTFGDARCDLDVSMSKADIAAAVTSASHTFKAQPQTIACKIEREAEITDVTITLAPEIRFKDGKAEKAYLHVSEIEAPTMIKGAIWTVTKLEDTFGLFHSQMISEINEFIHEKCPKRYPKS